MSKEKKAMIVWIVIGIIFLSVCLRDFYNYGSSHKSLLIIIFEGVAGIASFLNALNFRRKSLSKKAA